MPCQAVLLFEQGRYNDGIEGLATSGCNNQCCHGKTLGYVYIPDISSISTCCAWIFSFKVVLREWGVMPDVFATAAASVSVFAAEGAFMSANCLS